MFTRIYTYTWNIIQPPPHLIRGQKLINNDHSLGSAGCEKNNLYQIYWLWLYCICEWELQFYSVNYGYTWPHGRPFVLWGCLVATYMGSRCLISPWYSSHISWHWTGHYRARNVSWTDKIKVIPQVMIISCFIANWITVIPMKTSRASYIQIMGY